MHNTFTIKEALSFAWKKMSENFWFLVLLTLVFSVLTALLDTSGSHRGAVDLLSQILNLILRYFAIFTFVRVALKIFHGHKPTWNDVIEFNVNSFGLYVLGAIIFTILSIVGFVLLVIPGIIVAIRLHFFTYALLDHEHANMMPVPALKKSFEITRGHFWHLLGFTLVLALINILGAMALVIGLLITIPFCVLATAYVYQKLKAAPHHAVSTSSN